MTSVRITSGRHPYEVVLLTAAPVVALILTLTNTRPAAVDAAMPGPVRVVWVILLALSGLTGLTGVFWTGTGTVAASLSIEAVGVLVLGTAAAMYTVGIVAFTGFSGAAAGGFVAAVGIGSWWRLSQIWRDLRRFDQAVEAQLIAEVRTLIGQRDSHE
ncbi:hypothetical protein [Rugosimonospora africana]|uniref:Uncharacterized protein n=1 Tax=Rugosimonospora africana TaxID=556532 RepID=A0A8J3VWE2_9ACTN|nr:hypothetical protein [Rugosimonospora africana]GIH20668.1 hypothetical protein Raf01_88400 [Rugosimonospora africana]